jgi:hypothetical protein
MSIYCIGHAVKLLEPDLWLSYTILLRIYILM